MLGQTLKLNINRIDNDLKNLFEKVDISEKAIGNKFYFEIQATSNFENLSESLDTKRATMLVRVEKRYLDSDFITWSYSINPLKESKEWVERVSHIGCIAEDIQSVVLKKQLDNNYIKSLKSVYEPINENLTQHVEVVQTPSDKLKSLIESLDVKVTKVETLVLEQVEMFSIPDQIWRYHHKGWVNLTDMFRIETVLINQPGVNLVLFKEGYIEINFSPFY
jgi:hypothetical protein